jgi:hypothetical protein
MPYSGLERGLNQLGAGIGQAFAATGSRRRQEEERQQSQMEKQQSQMDFMREARRITEKNPEFAPLLGVDGWTEQDWNNISPAKFHAMFETRGQIMQSGVQQAQLQQQQAQAEEMLRQQRARELQGRLVGERFGEDFAGLTFDDKASYQGLANTHEAQQYRQAFQDWMRNSEMQDMAGMDLGTIQQIQALQEARRMQEQGVQFQEDPVTGHRFARLGNNMAGSGVNPTMAPQGGAQPQSSQGRLLADIRAARARGNDEEAGILEDIARKMAQGSMPNPFELMMYESQLKESGFTDQEVQEWMRSRLGVGEQRGAAGRRESGPTSPRGIQNTDEFFSGLNLMPPLPEYQIRRIEEPR